MLRRCEPIYRQCSSKRKRVLIFSYDGRTITLFFCSGDFFEIFLGKNGAPALALQYIMSYYNIPFAKAKSFLNNSFPHIGLSDNLVRSLELWQDELKKEREAKIAEAISSVKAQVRPAWNNQHEQEDSSD